MAEPFTLTLSPEDAHVFEAALEDAASYIASFFEIDEEMPEGVPIDYEEGSEEREANAVEWEAYMATRSAPIEGMSQHAPALAFLLASLYDHLRWPPALEHRKAEIWGYITVALDEYRENRRKLEGRDAE